MFTPLTKKDTAQIVEIQLSNLKKQLKENHINLVVKQDVVDWIAEKGYDPHYGARPVKRVIQKDILNQLSKDLLAQKIDITKNVVVDLIDNMVIFRKPISAEEELVI